MTLELQKAVGQLALPTSQDLGHRHFGVVIADPRRHRAKELEGPHMPLPEALGAFALEDPQIKRIAVGQAHHEEGTLPQDAIDVDQRVAEVHLRLPGMMG